MNMNIDMDTVQVGNKVGVGNYRGGYHIVTVDKVTAAQIVTSDGSRWTKRTGRRHGDGIWTFNEMLPLDKANELIAQRNAELAHARAANRLNDFNFRDLPADQLAKVTAIIDEHERTKEPQ